MYLILGINTTWDISKLKSSGALCISNCLLSSLVLEMKWLIKESTLCFQPLGEKPSREPDSCLGQFSLVHLATSGHIRSNSVIEASATLQSCILDDKRPASEEGVTRYVAMWDFFLPLFSSHPFYMCVCRLKATSFLHFGCKTLIFKWKKGIIRDGKKAKKRETLRTLVMLNYVFQ